MDERAWTELPPDLKQVRPGNRHRQADRAAARRRRACKWSAPLTADDGVQCRGERAIPRDIAAATRRPRPALVLGVGPGDLAVVAQAEWQRERCFPICSHASWGSRLRLGYPKT